MANSGQAGRNAWTSTAIMSCSEDVFAELADRVSEFENLSYSKIGDRGAKIDDEPAQLEA